MLRNNKLALVWKKQLPDRSSEYIFEATGSAGASSCCCNSSRFSSMQPRVRAQGRLCATDNTLSLTNAHPTIADPNVSVRSCCTPCSDAPVTEWKRAHGKSDRVLSQVNSSTMQSSKVSMRLNILSSLSNSTRNASGTYDTSDAMQTYFRKPCVNRSKPPR